MMATTNTSPGISDLLKFIQCQMAAEAFLVENGTIKSEDNLKSALVTGNDRSSKFTQEQAATFAEEWEVVAQQENTGTGFSATLMFNDKTKEYVLSFRSTEFADDAVRDNLATNTMEIKEHGWAFGQIADMETWWNSDKIPAEARAAKITVTGYSLGGHLATAFNLLHGDDIAATYTINGAGVGNVDKGTLSEIINRFNQDRKNGIQFTNAKVQALYVKFRENLNGETFIPSVTDYAEIDALLYDFMNDESVQATTGAHELAVLRKALGNINAVWEEHCRVAGLTDSKKNPNQVS